MKQREGRQDQPLPPLGAVLAVDSTLFETYANPNRPVVSDPDARWGVKHSSRTKNGKTDWGFGYKMHLVSDAIHGVPLAFTVTAANEKRLSPSAHSHTQGPGRPPVDGARGIAGRPGLR